MEFKDKLKRLRVECGLSQQALADAIFVSRSAVAKWENGLGLPCEESLDALAHHFGVERASLCSDDPERIIVEKNKRMRLFGAVACALALLLSTAFGAMLFASFASDTYGITSKLAAGSFADNPCIRTDDYDFYLSLMDVKLLTDLNYSNLETTHQIIVGFRPVKRTLLGYRVLEDYVCRKLYYDEKLIGSLYTIEGDDVFYNIMRITLNVFPPELEFFDTVLVGEREYPVQYCSYFVTAEIPNTVGVNDITLTLGEEVDRVYIMPG